MSADEGARALDELALIANPDYVAEAHGRRYALVVQADDLLALATIVVCPTSTSTPAASFHPEVEIDEQTTRVMCEMVGASMPGCLAITSATSPSTRCARSTTRSNLFSTWHQASGDRVVGPPRGGLTDA